MPRVIKEFGEAVSKELADRHWSYRRATIATGVQHATIGAMASGVIPGEDHVIRWAKALRQPINHWLGLAGYDPIPPELIEGCFPLPKDPIEKANVYLSAADELSEQSKQRIREIVLVEIEKRDRAKKTGE